MNIDVENHPAVDVSDVNPNPALLDPARWEARNDINECQYQFVCFWAILEVIATIVVLIVSSHEEDKLNLRMLNVLYAFRYCVQLPLMYWRNITRREFRDTSVQEFWLEVARLYEWVMIMVMTTVLFKKNDAHETEQILFSFTLAQVCVFLFFIMLPILLCLLLPCFILCTVPIVMFLYRFIPGPGASPEQLEKLGCHSYGDPDAPQMGFQDTQCSVCLDEYENGNEFRILPCGHGFHKHCIDTWLQKKAICPMCRTWVFEDRRINNQNILFI